ncbi:NTP transferase domain-containing protein [Ideonella sp.]|uniref:nucleotidyltransferase family protein n=1 Tax=Ideonella sp. TaxID=1929293 RepID=UPI0035B40A8A
MPDPGEGVPRAVLLAAGQGSRLGGRPKGSLRIAGVTLIERLAHGLRDAGIHEIAIVLGPYLDTMLPIAERAGLQVLRHAAPMPSRIDSQRLAISHHASTAPAHAPLWLVLADLPWLAATQFRAVAEAWAQRPPGAQMMVPTVGASRGHPVVLGPHAVRLIDARTGLGVRQAMQGDDLRVWRWRTADPAHIRDLDTAQDIQCLSQALAPASVDW